ncbi:MAG: replication initiator protein [Microvirus sp.]|nr:MAG: replication initiator protein [Microvirus sp.]
MPCYRPVPGFQDRPGLPLVFSRAQAVSSQVRPVSVPCNGCVGCYLERARQWAMRCTDEASLYRDNSFVTLTFDDVHLKKRGRGLDHRDFQLFMKRLRKFIGGQMVRFFMCGEYGELYGRPHYHGLLFNLGFPDRVYLKTTKSGEKIYRSPSLESNWEFGYSSVGDVTFGSAAYVARYHVKKSQGVVSKDHYVDKRTGELLPPEYIRMSRGSSARKTGGIGRGWFEKFKSDVYPRDVRVIKGVDTKPPRFYDALYEIESPDDFSMLKARRIRSVDRKDNSESRLLVKEKVKLAQIASLSNSLEEIYK